MTGLDYVYAFIASYKLTYDLMCMVTCEVTCSISHVISRGIIKAETMAPRVSDVCRRLCCWNPLPFCSIVALVSVACVCHEKLFSCIWHAPVGSPFYIIIDNSVLCDMALSSDWVSIMGTTVDVTSQLNRVYAMRGVIQLEC